MRIKGLACLIVFVAAAELGAEERPRLSLGYAFARYLEEGGGSAPVGAYLSLWSPRRVGIELDLGYQRDTEQDVSLNTLTAVAGPRISGASGALPFFHVLGGIRYDTIEGESNTSVGGMAGGGVDLAAGGRLRVRLGADVQIFFDEGENLKTLRLNAGLTF